jgi:LytS/YehU family sensor histidine kinase
MGIYIIYLSQQEKYSLQQRLIGLELATLKSNLNPHFIFNMMNLIQSMIVRSEQKRALKAISELAKINRLFLETSNKELISLVEEIDFAKKYVSLEQMRFEEDKQFTFKLNIEPNIELNHWLLPPLVVQPLLENSLKHGVLLTKRNPTMGITISLTNPYTLNILIYNSLPESNQRRSDGTNMGIHLVTERIKWVNEKYNEIQSIKMDVLPRMNNEFQVLITITKKDSSWLENL